MDIEEFILLKEHSQLLVMNAWQHEIPQEQRNIIIAEALNRCVIDLDFFILGYLITNRRVFLIGSSETRPFQKILQHFYKQVALGIIAYKNRMRQYNNEYILAPEATQKLFKEFPFYNDHIRQLITGKEVELPYYDPHLARLKNYIYHSNYCSASDYHGKKSPVIVATNNIIL